MRRQDFLVGFSCQHSKMGIFFANNCCGSLFLNENFIFLHVKKIRPPLFFKENKIPPSLIFGNNSKNPVK